LKYSKASAMPHLEAPERFNELLLRFLDEAE
jgi:pimeloyl-ACP methyl ester carboxylesterase